MAKVTYGTIEVNFRRPTNADAFRREAIVSRLGADDEPGMKVYYRLFGRIVTQATDHKGLPFALPSSDSGDDELKAAFRCFFDQMDESFGDACLVELMALDAPVDEALGPDPLPKNVKKK